MSTGLLKIIKQAASETEDNAKPTDLRYGTVVSVNPLSVQVTNQFTLPSSVLVVPQSLTDYSIQVEIPAPTMEYSGKTDENEGEDVKVDPHTHPYSGTIEGKSNTITIPIYRGLQVGDKVALLRQRGGQSYFILDRI